MFGIGVPEIIVILIVALLVLGPDRLPEVARAIGKGLAELRRATGGLTDELREVQRTIEKENRILKRPPTAQPRTETGRPAEAGSPAPERKQAPAPPAAAGEDSSRADDRDDE